VRFISTEIYVSRIGSHTKDIARTATKAYGPYLVGACFKKRQKSIRMARKTVRVSDVSGQVIPDGKGAVVRIAFADARRGIRELDVTDAEAESFGGRAVARRGRKP
jgi:hypothetical protein